MEVNQKSIDNILMEQREKLHKELLSNETYRELVKIDGLIAFSRKSSGEDNITEASKEETPLKKKLILKKRKPVPKGNTSPEVSIIDEDTFPLDGRRARGRQLRFLVKEFGKAISKSDLEDLLEERLGKRINVREALKRGVRLGDLAYVKFNKSTRYSFVILPSWVEEDRHGKKLLKSEYSPDVKDLPHNLNYRKQEIDGV